MYRTEALKNSQNEGEQGAYEFRCINKFNFFTMPLQRQFDYSYNRKKIPTYTGVRSTELRTQLVRTDHNIMHIQNICVHYQSVHNSVAVSVCAEVLLRQCSQ